MRLPISDYLIFYLAPFPSYGWLYVKFSQVIGGRFTLTPSLGWSPLNIRINFTSPETRRNVLPDAENRTIVSSFVWTKHRNATDRWTDGRTESLWLLQRFALREMRMRGKNTQGTRGRAEVLSRCMECRRGLAMRILSVRLSACLSVSQMRALWQNGRKISPDIHTIRKII